ncbi:branched-chain amino acid ABC transporter permease [Nocardia yamanashiensis]|uniref:branched-chain amino acid ABC transporter permease n=1 Tax=Nocardia yamanashiensis TaxID=209247 RepID=UPI00082FA918|nr:branched-chain amino acid ABC transporter permease [Nocardia yamanashiensis]
MSEFRRPLVIAVLIALACYAPFQLLPFRTFQLAMALVYAVALLGLNLLVGQAGQISLGHGAFFAAGAYTAAVLVDRWDVPHYATLPIAALVAFVLGFALGIPALRLRGLYLALVTLAIAIFTVPLLKRFESVTGGSMGLTLSKPAPPSWSGLAEDQWLYFLALATALLAGLVVGGLGSLWGPLLGGLFVMYVPSLAQDVNQAAPGVVFGLFIIAVMYLAPTGLAGLPGRSAHLFRKGKNNAH